MTACGVKSGKSRSVPKIIKVDSRVLFQFRYDKKNSKEIEPYQIEKISYSNKPHY